jgi:hypothetical protein
MGGVRVHTESGRVALSKAETLFLVLELRRASVLEGLCRHMRVCQGSGAVVVPLGDETRALFVQLDLIGEREDGPGLWMLRNHLNADLHAASPRRVLAHGPA